MQRWIVSQPKIARVVYFVPFYEVGSDFFVQCKPPYDGGYSTRQYQEFLTHGSCEPAEWFYQQLANLHRKVAERVRPLRHGSEKEQLLAKIVHATLIAPYGHLFWLDEQGWAVYQPAITAADVQQWANTNA